MTPTPLAPQVPSPSKPESPTKKQTQGPDGLTWENANSKFANLDPNKPSSDKPKPKILESDGKPTLTTPWRSQTSNGITPNRTPASTSPRANKKGEGFSR